MTVNKCTCFYSVNPASPSMAIRHHIGCPEYVPPPMPPKPAPEPAPAKPLADYSSINSHMDTLEFCANVELAAKIIVELNNRNDGYVPNLAWKPDTMLTWAQQARSEERARLAIQEEEVRALNELRSHLKGAISHAPDLDTVIDTLLMNYKIEPKQ